MKKWNVTLSICSSVYLEGVEADSDDAIIEGDIDQQMIEEAFIKQIRTGDSTLDWVVDEVQRSEQ